MAHASSTTDGENSVGDEEQEQITVRSIQEKVELINNLQFEGPNNLLSLFANETAGCSEDTKQMFSIIFNGSTIDEKLCTYILELISEEEATDSTGITPLIKAAKAGNLVATKYFLVSKNATLERKDNFGLTPLSWAAKMGHLDIVDFLIQQGADVNSICEETMTPVQHAVCGSHWRVVESLVEGAAEVNRTDKNGDGMLHRVIRAGNWSLVRYLIDRGADFLLTDASGNSALSYAIKNARWQVAKNMLKQLNLSGLSPDEKNNLLNAITLGENIVSKQFYNVIHLENPTLFEMLVDKTMCAQSSNVSTNDIKVIVESAISEAYEEFKFKNVPLSKEIESHVQGVLIKSRFFAERNDTNTEAVLVSLEETVERINLVCDYANDVKKAHYSDEGIGVVDDEYFFALRFITQNVRILKRQLKPTYDRLPWEEIEFCLAIYTWMHCQPSGNGSFFNLILDHTKIVMYLIQFSEELQRQKIQLTKRDINGNFPRKQNRRLSARSNIKTLVLSNNPSFQNLYDDFEKMRNISSIERIMYYIKLATSVNLEENKDLGMLVIERALQVVGESLKNTIESPNISEDVQVKLISSSPAKLRDLVTGLRDSLSHTISLKNKVRLENTGSEFFRSVQLDLEKVGVEVQDVLYHTQVGVIEAFSKRIAQCESLSEAKNLAIFVQLVDFDKITPGEVIEKKTMQQIRGAVGELQSSIKELTKEEELNFERIYKAIDSEYEKLTKRQSELNSTIQVIRGLSNRISLAGDITVIKVLAQQLFNMEPFKFTHSDDIFVLVGKLFDSIRQRVPPDDAFNIHLLCHKIMSYVQFDVEKVIGIDVLKAKLEGAVALNFPKDEADTRIHTMLDEFQRVLPTDENRASFQREMTQRQLAYTSKCKAKVLVEKLKCGTLHYNDPEVSQIYADLCQHLDMKKARRQTLDKLFHNQQWEECEKIIRNLRDNYEIFVNSVKKLLDADTCSDLSKPFKEFFNTVFKGSSFLKVLTLSVDDVFTSNDQELHTLFRERLFKLSQLISNNRDTDFLDSWENDKKLQAGVEMLLLDLLEIIDTLSLFGDNRLFIDECSPMLIGKPLRNYLAHGDCLIDSMPFNPTLALIKSAVILLDNGVDWVRTSKMVVGRKTVLDLSALMSRYGKCLHSVIVQNKMCTTSKFGSVEEVERCIFAGADVHGWDFEGWTGLHYAAMGDNLDVFLFYVEHNVDIKLRNFKGMTVLHLSAFYESINVLQYLLEQNLFSVDEKDIKGMTPLMIATQNGWSNIVQMLLDNGANIDNTEAVGMTALHTAANNGCLNVVQILLSNNANIHALSKSNWTPLHYAIYNNHLDIIELLLSKGAVSDSTHMKVPLLQHAAFAVQKDVIQTLLDKGIGTHELMRDDCMALHAASSYGQTEMVMSLLAKGARIDAKTEIGWTPLHYASISKHLEVVQVLLDHGADPQARNKKCATPLHFACSGGDADIVDLLLTKGAYIECVNKELWTPLMLAANDNKKDIIDILLQKGANVNAVNVNKRSALHWAALGGHTEIVAKLLENGADVNATDDDNLTPIIIAAYNNHKDVLELCRKYEAGKDIAVAQDVHPQALIAAALGGHEDLLKELTNSGPLVDNKLLTVAARLGRKDMIQTLLSCGGNVNELVQEEEFGPLHVAALKGHIDVLKSLLDSGMQVDTLVRDNITPLHLASLGGETECVRVLVARGADIEAQFTPNTTALHLATINGHLAIVETLLVSGANVNGTSNDHITPLGVAVQWNRLAIAKFLLENGAVVNLQDIDGSTPLHIATKKKDHEMVSLLLNNGADTNIQNNDGHTPLHISSSIGENKTVLELLTGGANIDVTDNLHRTPLLYSSVNGHKSTVEILLSCGANVNIADENDMSPLHYTARNGAADLVDILLEKKPTVDCVDKKGFTPLMYAAGNDHQKIMEKLLQNGADIEFSNERGLTALHHSSRSSTVDCVEFLLNHGAGIETQDQDGWTPLFYSLTNERKQIVETLLERGADFESTDIKGLCALDYAALLNIKDVVHAILKKKVLVQGFGTEVINELHVAACMGASYIIRNLMATKADVNVRDLTGRTPLMYAAQRANVSIVQLLVEAGADVNAMSENRYRSPRSAPCRDHVDQVNEPTWSQERTDVHNAHSSTKGHTAMIADIMNRWADVTFGQKDGVTKLVTDNTSLTQAELENSLDDNFTPLHFASFKNQTSIMHILLDHGACIEARTNNCHSPLHLATLAGHMEAVSVLLHHKADVRARTNNRSTALHIAALNNHLGIVKVLLDHGAIVNVVDDKNQTPIHIAVRTGDVDMCKILLDYGAKVNGFDTNNDDTTAEEQESGDLRNKESTSPLHLALENGHKEVALYLLDRGADVSLQKSGTSLLHLAARHDDVQLMQLLLDRTREATGLGFAECLDAADGNGNTPLMWAARSGASDAARLLLLHGVRVDAVNDVAETALHWAVTHGHIHMIRLLLENDASVDELDSNNKSALVLALEKCTQLTADSNDTETYKEIAAMLLSLTQ